MPVAYNSLPAAKFISQRSFWSGHLFVRIRYTGYLELVFKNKKCATEFTVKRMPEVPAKSRNHLTDTRIHGEINIKVTEFPADRRATPSTGDPIEVHGDGRTRSNA